jgi:hypothetical protein
MISRMINFQSHANDVVGPEAAKFQKGEPANDS